jgi:sodium-dependent dicarboxylate transporter 2/3/5
MPIAYLLITKFLFTFHVDSKINIEVIKDEIKKIGKISYEERTIQLVFLFTALLWIFRPLLSNLIPGISDSSIAILGAVLLFIIPSRNGTPVLEWIDAKKISWGILILFGGGLSLAQGIKNSGLAEWIASNILNIGNIPLLLLIIILTASIIFLTEITSNTATTAAFLPIIASIGTGMGIDPLQLVIPSTVAASCAFMLPVATPPNAIIFSSEEISIKNMAKAGIYLNIIFIGIVVFLSYTIGSVVFGY